MNLEQAADRAVNTFMGVMDKEKVLIVTDKERRKIGEALYNSARKITPNVTIVEVSEGDFCGMEPPVKIANMMNESNVVFAPLGISISHSQARAQANRHGARIATMPKITEQIFCRGMAVSPERMVERTEKLKKILDDAKEVRVVTEAGTDITFSAKGRKAIGSNGITHEHGGFCNLPEGEVFVAPVEGTANGKYVVDGSILGQKVDKPVVVTVKDGMAIDVSGGEVASQLKMILGEHGMKAKNIAEFGIGTNDKAILSGNVLEDEKVMGTCHIALGNNATIGGKVNASVHIDGIILRPSVYVNRVPIMGKGKLIS